MSGEQDVVLPDIEIIIRAADFDVAIVAMFKRAQGGFDIVCGIQSPDDAGAVGIALQEAATAIVIQDWQRIPSPEPHSGSPF